MNAFKISHTVLLRRIKAAHRKPGIHLLIIHKNFHAIVKVKSEIPVAFNCLLFYTFAQSCVIKYSSAISQKNMTTKNPADSNETCPVQGILRLLAGKWKPEIFRLAVESPLRFSILLRKIQGSNRQSLSVALRELDEAGLLDKVIVQQKPLHIEYHLSEKGKSFVPVFQQLETLSWRR